MAIGVLWAPILAALATAAVKFALALRGTQPLNGRGMPSGHAAAMAALITQLVRTGSSKDALGVAVLFSVLYTADLLLFYYAGPAAKDGLPLGHSLQEIAAGAAVGVVTTLFSTAAPAAVLALLAAAAAAAAAAAVQCSRR